MDRIDKAFTRFPILETERFILRRLVPADAEAIFEIFGDDEVTRYYDLYTFAHLDEAHDLIDFIAESYASERQIRWGIARREDDRVIGTCGFVWLREHRAEIGYDLARAYWGQGVMAEALTAVLDYGFHTLRLNRIEAIVMVENEPSARLLRKLGFQEEGLLREYDFFKDAFHDMRSFAILKREHESRRPAAAPRTPGRRRR